MWVLVLKKFNKINSLLDLPKQMNRRKKKLYIETIWSLTEDLRGFESELKIYAQYHFCLYRMYLQKKSGVLGTILGFT